MDRPRSTCQPAKRINRKGKTLISPSADADTLAPVGCSTRVAVESADGQDDLPTFVPFNRSAFFKPSFVEFARNTVNLRGSTVKASNCSTVKTSNCPTVSPAGQPAAILNVPAISHDRTCGQMTAVERELPHKPQYALKSTTKGAQKTATRPLVRTAKRVFQKPLPTLKPALDIVQQEQQQAQRESVPKKSLQTTNSAQRALDLTLLKPQPSLDLTLRKPQQALDLTLQKPQRALDLTLQKPQLALKPALETVPQEPQHLLQPAPIRALQTSEGELQDPAPRSTPDIAVQSFVVTWSEELQDWSLTRSSTTDDIVQVTVQQLPVCGIASSNVTKGADLLNKTSVSSDTMQGGITAGLLDKSTIEIQRNREEQVLKTTMHLQSNHLPQHTLQNEFPNMSLSVDRSFLNTAELLESNSAPLLPVQKVFPTVSYVPILPVPMGPRRHRLLLRERTGPGIIAPIKRRRQALNTLSGLRTAREIQVPVKSVNGHSVYLLQAQGSALQKGNALSSNTRQERGELSAHNNSNKASTITILKPVPKGSVSTWISVKNEERGSPNGSCIVPTKNVSYPRHGLGIPLSQSASPEAGPQGSESTKNGKFHTALCGDAESKVTSTVLCYDWIKREEEEESSDAGCCLVKKEEWEEPLDAGCSSVKKEEWEEPLDTGSLLVKKEMCGELSSAFNPAKKEEREEPLDPLAFVTTELWEEAPAPLAVFESEAGEESVASFAPIESGMPIINFQEVEKEAGPDDAPSWPCYGDDVDPLLLSDEDLRDDTKEQEKLVQDECTTSRREQSPICRCDNGLPIVESSPTFEPKFPDTFVNGDEDSSDRLCIDERDASDSVDLSSAEQPSVVSEPLRLKSFVMSGRCHDASWTPLSIPHPDSDCRSSNKFSFSVGDISLVVPALLSDDDNVDKSEDISSEQLSAVESSEQLSAVESKTASSFACQLCDESFPTRAHLRIHVTSHNTASLFYCPICFLKFRHVYRLRAHQPTHNTDCPACGRAHHSRSSLQLHVSARHLLRGPYECVPCGQRFRVRNKAVRHLTSAHTNVGQFYCSQCDVYCGSMEGFAFHVRNEHGSEDKESRCALQRAYACLPCGERFACPTSLGGHMAERHLGTVGFQCDVPCCDKEFKSRNMLRNHIMLHDALS